MTEVGVSGRKESATPVPQRVQELGDASVKIDRREPRPGTADLELE
jgi:hypothetical protein